MQLIVHSAEMLVRLLYFLVITIIMIMYERFVRS